MTAPVLWFLGLSGSGKSTLAKAAFDHVTSRRADRGPSRWELLDGDKVRAFFGNDLGYTASERRKSVKISGLLARYLSANDVGVVVAHISPFQDLRAFLRAHVPEYVEIYCRCSLSTCMERDPKGHYRNQSEAGGKDFVGLDIPFEEPREPDLVIETSNRPVAESVRDVQDFIDRRLGAIHP